MYFDLDTRYLTQVLAPGSTYTTIFFIFKCTGNEQFEIDWLSVFSTILVTKEIKKHLERAGTKPWSSFSTFDLSNQQ